MPESPQFDISNKPSPHSLKHRAGRTIWYLVQATLFRFSPRPLKRWRVFLLNLFGARISPTARIQNTVQVWAPWQLEMGDYATLGDHVIVYSVDPIKIGAQSTVSQYSYLCGATHDFEHPNFLLTPGPIMIGNNCWIAADVFVAPNVTIGDGTVVGARSSVFHSLPSWKVCVGTPCKPIKDRIIRSDKQPAPEPQREGAPA